MELRNFRICATLVLLPWLASPSLATEAPGLLERIDASLAGAGRYLIERQSDDGGWYSETYGALRVGPTLTPYVMSSLFYLPQAGPRAADAYTRGVDYLAGFVGEDGRLDVVPRQLWFPVYTSASASRVVVLQQRSARNLRAQRAWLSYLRQRQLNESLGWQPSDPQYGGWGFSIEVPRKPKKGEPCGRFVESNLAATIFGLAALRSARVPTGDPAYAQALTFVRRCQNFSDDPARHDPDFDDGGLFFIPDDPVQNKAGVAGTDRFGRGRFHSYGTMTADGLRAMIRCGLPHDHPRVVAARKWLKGNFSATSNPGHFAGDRAVLQDATYYYWAWALGHALLAIRPHEGNRDQRGIRWETLAAGQLADELLRRQRPDGSWANRFTDAKEDDPLVATPWAAAALAICRAVQSGERKTL